MANNAATSREAVLKAGRDLLLAGGVRAVSIRAVAEACGVSVGTVYNYVDGKSELVQGIVRSIWLDVFHGAADDPMPADDILGCLAWFYRRLEDGARRYPGFFNGHTLVFADGDRADARAMMRDAVDHMIAGLAGVMERDLRVRADAFGPGFERERFAALLFSLVMSAAGSGDYDPSVVLEMTRRAVL